MAEIPGSRCDTLTIVKLKALHREDAKHFKSQAGQLVAEIAQCMAGAHASLIPVEKLSFAVSKLYKEAGNETKTRMS